MANVNPLLLVGAVIGVVTALLVLACALVKDKKETMGYERTMNDGEILRRLAGYAKPYLAKFVVVLFLMLFSIAYDIISPLIVGALEELVSGEFELPRLFAGVAVYAGVLVFSMASTYFQAVILQRVGQRIISDLREDLFTHIESLSHEQLNEIPVGKLVTRVTNDTNAISMMFTNLLVTLTKNIFVILGILVAMLALNYELTLMVLCFVPFIVIFTVIFRKFSRRAYRKVKDATTDINTYLSENLSEIGWVKELCPWSTCYGDAYDHFGLLGEKTIMAHCVYSTDEEVDLLRRTGTYIAHCPQSNAQLASGIAPIRRYLDLGMNVGLATDVAGGADLSMWRCMADAVAVSKLRWRLVDQSLSPLTTQEAFWMATMGGGSFFGKVGSFAEGYELDALVLDDSAIRTPRDLTVWERLERYVYLAEEGGYLTRKFVAGRQIDLD